MMPRVACAQTSRHFRAVVAITTRLSRPGCAVPTAMRALEITPLNRPPVCGTGQLAGATERPFRRGAQDRANDQSAAQIGGYLKRGWDKPWWSGVSAL